MSSPSAPREEVIPILRVRVAAATAGWYERLGFKLVNVYRFEPGFPAFATIQRGDISLFLSEHTGDARPDTLVYLRVRDAERLARKPRRTYGGQSVGTGLRDCRSRWQPTAHRHSQLVVTPGSAEHPDRRSDQLPPSAPGGGGSRGRCRASAVAPPRLRFQIPRASVLVTCSLARF